MTAPNYAVPVAPRPHEGRRPITIEDRFAADVREMRRPQSRRSQTRRSPMTGPAPRDDTPSGLCMDDRFVMYCRQLSGPPDRHRWPALFVTRVVAMSTTALRDLSTSTTVGELARFRRAVNLTADDAKIVALVTPELGNGPFHVVVDTLPPRMTGATPVRWAAFGTVAREIRLGSCRLQIDRQTELWEPKPRWDWVQITPQRLGRLHRLLQAQPTLARSPFAPVANGEAAPHTDVLREALIGRDGAALAEATGALLGLGPGLTPSSDDFLVGLICALRATHHPEADRVAHIIARGAGRRTTRISCAYLDAARRGEVDERWHRLLTALTSGDDLEAAVKAVAAFGATSGVDTLLGFLWGGRWALGELR